MWPLIAVCRQMFANHRLAFAAAEMEVQEAKARLDAQNQLAAAQSQVCPPIMSTTFVTLAYALRIL